MIIGHSLLGAIVDSTLISDIRNVVLGFILERFLSHFFAVRMQSSVFAALLLDGAFNAWRVNGNY